MKLPMIFSQNDKAWAGNKLGLSNLTIGGFGCLITAYAIVLRFFGRKTNPAMVNRLLIRYNGFTKYGAYYWNSLAKIYEYEQKYIDTRNREVSDKEMEELEKYLKKAPVIIQVDMKPNTAQQDMHFVVAYGMKGDELLIADPWGGVLTTLSHRYKGKYNPTIKRAIYRIIYFAPKL